MAEATGVMQEVNAVFGDSGEDIRTTLANFSSITTTFDDRLPGMLDEVDTALGSINSLTEDLGGFVDRAEQSVDGVDALLADAGGLTRELRARRWATTASRSTGWSPTPGGRSLSCAG
ncbi:hypothetical protein OT109_08480 [Phycisphaeraceae bacterium D3-23]